MKQKLLIVFVMLSMAKHLAAQNVGIGTTTPNASAALDITSTTKGILIPRMTTVQRDAIVSPAVGLMILNLDDKCADIYNGTAWIKNCGFSVTIDTLPGYWTQKADFGGTTRWDAVGFSIGTKGYIGTGRDQNGFPQKDFWEYDPSVNSWTQKAFFGGTERYGAVGFSIGAKGYIGTGLDNTNAYKKDFWEYDTTGNIWTPKADFGGTERYFAAGFSINGKGYIGTGNNPTFSDQKDFWEYDTTTNSWIQKADFYEFRAGAVGFSIGSKGYLGTGSFAGNRRNDFWEYNPVTDSWVQKANFGGTARSSAAGFSINGKGYIGTGLESVSPITFKKDFWEYDTLTNSWTQKSDFGGTARYAAVCFGINGKGYIGTGVESFSPDIFRKDFWEYDPYPLGSFYSGGSNISNNYYADDGLWVKAVDTLRNAATVNKIFLNGNTNITGKIIVSDSAILSSIKQDALVSPTLLNSWVNYGLGFADAKYYKDKEGVVHLKGLIKNGVITSGTVLFTLPVGYRPSTSGQLIFNADNNGFLGRVDVKANGDVVVVTATSNAFLNLTGISFRAD